MPERPQDLRADATPPPETETDLVIASFLEEHDAPTAGDVDALCNRYPAFQSDIRRRIERLRSLGMFGAASQTENERVPDQLGEFRLIRRLGGGGMGVVYQAEQTSLARVVALKLIRPEHLYFPGARERFRREVETVAKLQHPGIVPIYTVGEERGIPYFAMELIEGCTLAEVIQQIGNANPAKLKGSDLEAAVRARAPHTHETARRVPLFVGSWIEVCLRIVHEVAVALGHAHGRGVLHRDIKPSNILITPGGRILLFDFGLASSKDATQLTRAGSQVGSVPYMAPEVVNSELKSIDGRSDIYSLGVALYELLTLHSPFLGETVDSTHRNILEGDPLGPRKLNSYISADVATVCLKAMDRDRSRRYATAAAFALDIENTLQRRPIDARPPTAIRKIQRWIERHPAKTVAIALGLLLVAGIPSIIIYFQYKYSSELEQSFTRERTERSNSDHNFSLAVDAVDRMLTRFGQEELLEIPQAENVRRGLLEDALKFSIQFVEERGNEPAVLRAQARALIRVADIRRLLGAFKDAEIAADNATAVCEKLCTILPTDPLCSHELAAALSCKASILTNPARAKAAVPILERAIDVRRKLIMEQSAAVAGPELKHKLLDNQIELARAHGLLQQFNESAAVAAAAETEAGKAILAGEPAQHSELLLLISRAKTGLQKYDESNTFAKEAVRILEESVARKTANLLMRQRLADAYTTIASNYRYIERNDDAIEYFNKSRSIRSLLVKDFPNTLIFRQQLAMAGNNLGLVYCDKERRDLAEEQFSASVAMAWTLATTYPDNLDFQLDHAALQINRCANLVELDRKSEAFSLMSELAAQLEIATARFPNVVQLYELSSRIYNNIGAIFDRTGDGVVAAEEPYRKAILKLTKACELAPENRNFRALLVQLMINLAVDLRILSQFDEARAIMCKAFDMNEEVMRQADVNSQMLLSAAELANDIAAIDVECHQFETGRIFVMKAMDYQMRALSRKIESDNTMSLLISHSRELIRNLLLLGENRAALDYAKSIANIVSDAELAHSHCAAMLTLCARNEPDDDKADEICRLAVAELSALSALGFRQYKELESEPDLAFLFDREDFKMVMKQMAARSK